MFTKHVNNWVFPTSGSNYARRMGIHRTSAGQQVPIERAMSAQMLGLILGNIDKSLLFTIYSWQFTCFRCAVDEDEADHEEQEICRWNEVSRKEKVK